MSDTPRISGLEPTFTNIDDGDIPFIAVRSQRNADGSESHVWEKWVAFSVEPLYLALFARWGSGHDRAASRALQPAHSHGPCPVRSPAVMLSWVPGAISSCRSEPHSARLLRDPKVSSSTKS